MRVGKHQDCICRTYGSLVTETNCWSSLEDCGNDVNMRADVDILFRTGGSSNNPAPGYGVCMFREERWPLNNPSLEHQMSLLQANSLQTILACLAIILAYRGGA